MFVDDGIRLIDIAIGHFPHTQDCPASQFSAEISKIGTLIVLTFCNGSPSQVSCLSQITGYIFS